MRVVYYENGGGRCARCGGELLRVILAPDPRLGDYFLTPLCGQCATPEEVAYADTTDECPGCGITMHFSRWDAYTTPVACSTYCYQRSWRKPWRTKRRTCEVCGVTFRSRSKDGRFCSHTCRLSRALQATQVLP